MDEIQHIHGGNLRAEGEKYGLSIDNILDFSANINPLGPSELAIEALGSNLHIVKDYPDPHCTKLRNELGRFLQLDPSNIVMGNGAVELIYLLVKYLKPKKVLIPAPTFSEYEIAARTNDCQVQYLMLDKKEFNLPIQEIIDSLHQVDMVFICNPNNPTGKLTKAEDIHKIIKKGQETNTFVVIDEAFMDFVEAEADYSVLHEFKNYSNLFILYSLTKFHGIPGLRLGAGISNTKVIEVINQIRDPWNVNSLAQLAGEISLNDKEYILQTKAIVKEEKEFLYQELASIKGLMPFRPSVNYIFIDISGTGHTSTQLKNLLGKKGILVRDCASYVNLGVNYIRVAVKKREENERLIKIIKEVIDNT